VVGGGIAGFLIVNNKNNNHGGGKGSGSQIAGNDGSGDVSSQRGSARDGASGSGGSAGSGIVARLGSGAESGSNTTHEGSGADATHKGSDDVGGRLGSDAGSGQQGSPPPPVDVVHVKLVARGVKKFEVFDGDTKLFDGPGLLDVRKGETRTVTIKARGFRDKQLDVDGVNRTTPTTFSLEKMPDSGTGSGSGSTHVVIPPPPPPPKLDCTNKILDPTPNGPCIKQFCAAHKDNDKCQIE
jgi:hypothetical protein